ncbi:MAG TPA: nitroreductase/quinone reductase family protein [Acidimicrobiia bacterium]
MALDAVARDTLARHRTVDMTTYGRKTGFPRTIEIWWFLFEDRFIVTGTPGPRDWLANVRSDPRVIVAIPGMQVDSIAREVDDLEFRRRFFADSQARWYSTQAGYERLVAEAPMIELVF